MHKNTPASFVTLLFLLALFAAGCQTMPPVCNNGSVSRPLNQDAENLNNRLLSGRYLQKVDNLIIILDDTSSMAQCYNGYAKADYAEALLQRIAKTLPDIDLSQGLRIYGPGVDRYGLETNLLHGMVHIPEKTLKEVRLTKTVDTTIFSPLAMALEGVYHELKRIEGTSAVIILSDFAYPLRETFKTAELVKAYYQDRICVYPVVIGNDGPGRDAAEDIVNAFGCGIAAMHSSLNDGASLADFMEKVLFVNQPMVEPAPVSQHGLSYDKLLQERQLLVELKTEFDFDKSLVRPEYMDHLKEIADFMTTYQDTRTTIEGHTCSIGTEAYNLGLSRKRALAVKGQLVKQYGIDPERLAIAAYGETMPIADNSTQAGRRKNRRAVAVITTTIQERGESPQ